MTDDTASEKAAPDSAPTAAPEDEARAKLEAENADLKDRVLRALAEMDNLRKRTDREITDARAYAVASLARDLLAVADNLRRALDAIPEGAAEADDALKTFSEGVSLTERELLNAFAKHAVVRVDPQGERFDPNLHQAMFEVPDPSVPNGTVVQVVQPGYTLSGRVLRPAMVGVAKGGPKAGAADPGVTVDKSA